MEKRKEYQGAHLEHHTIERRKLLYLIPIMIASVLLVSGLTFHWLYRTSIEEQRGWLKNTAQSRARLIEAVARFDAEYSTHDHPEGSAAATLSQIIDAHGQYEGFGQTGEFTLAKREGDKIVFVLSHRHYDLDNPKPVPFHSDLAEPMERALAGLSGTMIGPDYRGVHVLAAYEPVEVLNLGLVAKMDITEIRSPFIKAGIKVTIIAIVAIIVGAFLFFRLANPLINNLQESEQRFRELTENIREVFWIQTSDKEKILYVSSAYEQIWGRTCKSLYENPKSWLVAIHPDDRQSVMESWLRWQVDSIFIEEYRIVRPDGDTRWILDRGFPIRDRFGKVYRIAGIAEDITERKQAEEQILKLSQAVEQSPSTVIITDTKGNIEYANPKFTQLTGYTLDEVIGQNPRILKSGMMRDKEYKQLWNTITSGREWRGEFCNRKKDGTFYWEDAIISPIKNPHGIITNFLAVKEDITGQKDAENERLKLTAQLLQAQKMETVGVLVSGVAHSFNNILAIMRGYVDMTLVDMPSSSQGYNHLQHINKGIEDAKELVNQMLVFSRQVKHEFKSIQIHSTIKDVFKLFSVSLTTHIEFHHKIDAISRPVLADANQIQQMVLNLLTNGCQAMPKKGGVLEIHLNEVEVDADLVSKHPNLHKGAYARLRVSDTGQGMDQATMEQIFEPFFTTKEVGKGTGLGLSVVHGIVMSHKGEITVESKPSKGTTFTVYLPLLDEDLIE